MLTPALQPLLSLTQLALAGESDIPSLVYASYLTGLPTLQALALKGLPVWTVPSLAHCTPRAHYLAQHPHLLHDSAKSHHLSKTVLQLFINNNPPPSPCPRPDLFLLTYLSPSDRLYIPLVYLFIVCLLLPGHKLPAESSGDSNAGGLCLGCSHITLATVTLSGK